MDFIRQVLSNTRGLIHSHAALKHVNQMRVYTNLT